jgi:hypothetical protein
VAFPLQSNDYFIRQMNNFWDSIFGLQQKVNLQHYKREFIEKCFKKNEHFILWKLAAISVTNWQPHTKIMYMLAVLPFALLL